MKFFAQNLRAFKRCALLLFVATILTGQADLYLSEQVEQAIRAPGGMSNSIYLFGFLSLVGSLLFPSILWLISLFGLREDLGNTTGDHSENVASFTSRPQWSRELALFFSRYTNALLIETLRAWGQTLKWTLLLVIPGIIRFIQLSLVPFVVTESRTYERGEVDALALSTRLVKKNPWPIVGLILIFHLFIPLLFTSLFDEYRSVLETPLPALLLSLVEAYLFLITVQCFFNVFQRSLSEAPR